MELLIILEMLDKEMTAWKNGKSKDISYNEVMKALKTVSLNKNHKIIVGTDSVKVKDHWVFTKAIAVFCDSSLYDRKYFYLREILHEDFRDLSKRLFKETEDSITLAVSLRRELNEPNIEIHADVNCENKHLSSKFNTAIKGYISGCGFNVKVKPDSFVASSIADNHTRKK